MTTSTLNQPQKIKEYELFLMGHPIFSAGQPGAALYIVVEGEAVVYQNDRLIKTLQPGEVLDKVSLTETYGSDPIAFAKTNCYLVPIDQKMAAVLATYPLDFRVQAMRVMVERLTFRLSPPIQLIVRPQPQLIIRTAPKVRSTSDTFGVVAAVGY